MCVLHTHVVQTSLEPKPSPAIMTFEPHTHQGRRPGRFCEILARDACRSLPHHAPIKHAVSILYTIVMFDVCRREKD